MEPQQKELAESPKLIDLNLHPDTFSYEEGFSRPNWPVIRRLLKEQVPAAELSSAWIEVGTQWMRKLVQEPRR